MNLLRSVLAGSLAATLCACGSSEEGPAGNSSVLQKIDAAPLTALPLASPTPTPANYAEREGDTYYYVSAVNDDDRKKGTALGRVLSFRYLGVSEGVHVIESLLDDGQLSSNYECSTACRIIKRRTSGRLERIPYDPSSVIGSVFEDALNGKLVAAKGGRAGGQATRRTPDAAEPLAAAPVIPLAFRGEWNADLTACGSGLNDSRLRIEARQVRFYESDGSVERVDQRSPRAVFVTGSFAGEGQTWTDTFEMVLSRSGKDLTVQGSTRQRCPNPTG